MPMDCASIDALQIHVTHFDNKYFRNWSDDAADVIFTIEGLRAKRAYIGFWPIFIFLLDRANFSQTDLF